MSWHARIHWGLLVSAALGAGWCAAGDPPTKTKLDRAAVLRELQDQSVAGVSRRFGPDHAHYHPKADETIPEIWMAPSKQEPGGRRYQIGGPWTKEGGDFSSTQGQVLYVPD